MSEPKEPKKLENVRPLDERSGWSDIDDWPQAPPETVLCRRVMRPVPVVEHERCPYCFGRRADIEKGRHQAFCDYDKDKDPVHFGFPPDESRSENG